ncbi:MAG TPA: peptidoglycan DD-metalloendopeptidase family protein [Thermoanaerobaculia bacterium]|nr:peptidoglycan DD-metalloendopeptidase family protein [Thermoanaerobaculia bacterium]
MTRLTRRRLAAGGPALLAVAGLLAAAIGAASPASAPPAGGPAANVLPGIGASGTGGGAGAGPPSAGQPDAGSGQPAATGETRAREAELAALRTEIAGLETRLTAARRLQNGAEGELAAADLALQLEGKRLAEAVVARDQAAEREAAGERQVKDLERALDERRREFQRRLTGLYRLGRQGYLRLFFLLRPSSNLLPSIRLMRYLVRHDREAVDSYQQAKDRLARRRDQLAAERQERDRWLGWEQTRRRELAGARQRKAALLARVERERSVLASRAVELADREHKLAAFLDLLYGRSATALAGTPMQQFRGILDWPAAGKVVERFGPRLDPRYRTQVPHNGIDLETAAGGEVKAVYPGKVLFAAPFEGYGLTVVVHHPGRVLTLYAGLSELRKAKDDMVSLAEPVGLASDRLYFEIRVENRPEDPMSWLH